MEAHQFYKYRARLGCSVLAITLLALGYYTLRLMITEDLESKRWTYSFFVCISSKTIRRFPVIKPIDSPTFTSSPGDGPAPPYNGIRYESHEDPNSLRSILESYLKNAGYAKTQEEGIITEKPIFKKGSNECELGISIGDNKQSQVTCIEYSF